MKDASRVLLITGEYPPMEGGVADFTAILGRTMAQQGAIVHVLTSVRAQQGRDDALLSVYPVMEEWTFRNLHRQLSALLDQVTVDVVNIQYQTAAYGLKPAINFCPWMFRKMPFVATFHDLRVPYLFPKAGPLREWTNMALARSSAGVIVTNAQDRERLAQVGGIRLLEMIPIGSNIPNTLPADYDRAIWRGQWGVASKTTLLCFFGFLNESKGVRELVEALRLLIAEGLDVDLMMVGGSVGASDITNRAYLERIKREIEELDLHNHVFWTGYMPDEEVSAALNSADIAVLPFRDGASFRRGSLMATLNHGLAVISTTPQVAIPELVHGENIWLVPPGDPRALADAIKRLARDPELRKRLGSGALELSQRFDWKVIAVRTLDLYHRAITAHRSRG